MSLVIGATYVHYKNKRYKVLGTARHSETLEEMVIYETLHENELGRVWVRPLTMFNEVVITPDYTGPRFRKEEL
jgi:hypothetical protein